MTLIDIIDIIEPGGVYMRKKVICYDDYYPASVYDREHQELETVAIFDELCKALGINSKNNPNLFYDENIEIIGKSFYMDALKNHKENQEAIFNDYTIDRLKYVISLALNIETNTRNEQYGLLCGTRKIKNTEDGLIITEAKHQSIFGSYETTRQFLDDIIIAISNSTDNVGGISLLSILLQDIEHFQDSQIANNQFWPGLSYNCIDAFKYFIYHFLCKMFEKCKDKDTVPKYRIRNSYLSILTRNYYYDVYTVLQDYMTYNMCNPDLYDLLPKNLPNNNYIDENGKEKVSSSYYHTEDLIRTIKTVFLRNINPEKYKDICEQYYVENEYEEDDYADDDEELK